MNASTKVAQKKRRDNTKQRKIIKKCRRGQRRKRRRLQRARRTQLKGKRFYSLEAFIRFIHKMLADILDHKLPKKGKQARFSWKSCLVAILVRCLLGLSHLSHFTEEIENNSSLQKAIGFKKNLTNTKPLTELLLKFTLPLAKWLFLQVALKMRAHGLIYGKTVSIDTCFLHIYGEKYAKAERGYSGQLKRTARGYKLWLVISVESKMPLAFELDSGNMGDTRHFNKVIGRANYVLGEGVLRRVLADRGFCSKELYWWLDKVMKLKFIFRAKAGESSTYVQKPVDALQASDYKRVSKRVRYAKTVVKGLKGAEYRLWVSKHSRYKNPLLLITNDWTLTCRSAKKQYFRRWTVETWFASTKGSFALGKFVSNKWNAVCGAVLCSILCSMLYRAFRLLMGKHYRKYSSLDFQQRVLIHGFSCSFEQLMKPSSVRGDALIAALQRVFTHLEQWDNLKINERFAHCRPVGFQAEVFELPIISLST